MMKKSSIKLIMASLGMVSTVPQSMQMKKPTFLTNAINAKDKMNWIANILFIRQDFDDCLRVVD